MGRLPEVTPKPTHRVVGFIKFLLEFHPIMTDIPWIGKETLHHTHMVPLRMPLFKGGCYGEAPGG